jgi:hypothetical protein
MARRLPGHDAVRGEAAFITLAEYLRLDRGLPGTKVVCAEGDCGACTVLVGRPVAGQVLMPVKVPSFTGLNGTTSRAGADSGVAVMAEPAGDADGLEDAGDLVRVVTTPHHPHLLWVHEHLQHLSSHIRAMAEPASHVAEQRRLPWWR